MSEFDQALAQAIEDGVARGRLPGASDALRRGRRRSLRARSGAAVLGVAAVGGAFGVTAALGGAGGGTTAAAVITTTATTPTTAGHSASVPTPVTESAPVAPPARGSGLLDAKLWPGYALGHWDPQPLKTPPAKAAGSMVDRCDTSRQDMQKHSFPIASWQQWSTTYYGPLHVSADESVFTFADAATAEAFLADARGAGTAAACGTGPTAAVPSPGASTASGVSWEVNQQDGGVDHLPSVDHQFLVRSGDRVALLRVSQFGTDFKSTVGDAKVLADLQQALEK